MSNNDWITEYIELNPHRPGPDEALIKEYGVPVWAIIGYLPAVGDSASRVAADYDLPLAAVEAAIAYYHQHRSIIDARIAANSAETRARLHAA
jgi:uncharacterized protein (DUF433 family)